MIAIIDYGAGNIQSVAKALTHIGCDCLVTRNKDEILKADGAVLPGVGSFGDTVDSLNKYGIKDAIKEYIASGKPFLGGSITRIPNGEGLKIPHMGWNSLDINPESRLFKGIGKNPYVYFVHSYFLHAADRELVAATTEYGVTIDAAVERGNVFATQFHPEKSGETGLRILRNFAEIVEG